MASVKLLDSGAGEWITLMYRRAMKTTVSEMEKDFSLMGNSKRIEIVVPYYQVFFFKGRGPYE